jgi:RNA polymerase sigma-70 factor (ECF subfamily)
MTGEMMLQLATAVERPTCRAESAADLDRQDISAARRGDLQAAERLYRRHRAKVLHLARLISGSQRDAEDVSQETFVKALSNLGGFRGEAAFSTWLCRIAINESRSLLARRRTRLKLVASSEEAELPRQRPQAELKVALARAVGALSEGQREVLICHDVLGMKHEEIAFALGCAAGTCKAQLHKARARVRQLLTEGQAS